MDQIIEFSRGLDVDVVAVLLTLPRIYAFLATSQLLSSSAVPGMARIASILSLTIIAVPINLEFAAGFDRSLTSYALFFGKEYAIGFMLGYLVGWIFWVVQSAGALIDNQRGAAIAASIDPLQGFETSPLGNLFSQGFLTYVFTTGAVLPVLMILYQSFAAWPATRGLPVISATFPVLMLAMLDNAMRMTFVLAVPVLAVMFFAEFALAIVSRFAPQVQVFILAMPIKSLLAIMMLIFYFPILLPFANKQLDSFYSYTQQFYSLLRFGETIRLPTMPRGPR